MDTFAPIVPAPVKTPPPSAASLFTLGADLLGQVQQIVGTDRVRALRVKFGGRTVHEIPVGPLTAAATVALVVLAVVVSTLSIEVEHEPADVKDSISDAKGEAPL